MCFVQLPCPLLSFLSLDLVVHLVVTPLQILISLRLYSFVSLTWQNWTQNTFNLANFFIYLRTERGWRKMEITLQTGLILSI